MKKILLSLLAILTVAGGAYYATNAFFSDNETSTGNVLGAGSIDLKVGNDSYYNGVLQDGSDDTVDTSWSLKNIDNEVFFNFTDLKPGDWGEDTIELKVLNNDSWACARLQLTKNDENTRIDPETDAGDDSDDGGDPYDGELAQNLYFIWWPDDGDNVLETDEEPLADLRGYLPDLLAFNGDDPWEVDLTLADAQWNFFTKTTDTPLVGEQPYYIGKAWCFGDITLLPVTEGQGVDPTVDSGIRCDGTNVDNMSQTDLVEGVLEFTAVQYRNNEGFLCPEHEPQP